MQKSDRLSFTEAIKTSVSIAIVRHQVNKLKDRQDEAEKIVPTYQLMIKRDPKLDQGHLVDFPMFKKRCTEAEEAVKNSKGLGAWLSTLEREKTFRTMTLELLEEANSYWGLSLAKEAMEIAEDTKKLFVDIMKNDEQKETRIQEGDTVVEATIKLRETDGMATMVLMRIAEEYGEEEGKEKIMACFSILDNAHIYGIRIYAAYKYICNEDIQKFIKKLHDGTLVDEIKKHPKCMEVDESEIYGNKTTPNKK